MKWITATEIDSWTTKEPRRAQEILLYPKTAAVVRRLSEDYRAEAKHERARELKGFT